LLDLCKILHFSSQLSHALSTLFTQNRLRISRSLLFVYVELFFISRSLHCMYLEPFCVSRSLLFTFQSRYRISPSLFIYLESFLYLTLSPFYLFRAVFVFHALSFLSIYSGSRSREMLLLQRRFAELETK